MIHTAGEVYICIQMTIMKLFLNHIFKEYFIIKNLHKIMLRKMHKLNI